MFKELWIIIKNNLRFWRKKIDTLRELSEELSKVNILYVKLFQILSVYQQKLSTEEMDILKYYTENVPYSRNELDIINLIKQLRNYNISLTSFEPIASGTIAVVYTAIDNKTGMRLIVKCKRKNIEEKLKNDLNSVKPFINLMALFSNLNIKDIFYENIDMLFQQTDFKNEVKNIKFYYDNNIDSDFLKIPKVYDNITVDNDSIIVMEYLEGRRLTNITIDEEKDKYSKNLSKTIVKSLLLDRVFHGDMHQGNIIFMSDYKIGLIDYGIVGYVTREEQDIYFTFLKHMNAKRIEDMTELVVDNLLEPQNIIDNLSQDIKDELYNKLMNFFKDVLESKTTISFPELNEIGIMLKKYKLFLSKKFCKFELSMACNEGVINYLAVIEPHPFHYMTLAIEDIFPEDILDIIDF